MTLLPVLRDTDCAFVTTAVESLDDEVLARLDKGHTRADVEAVVARSRVLGLALAPTFIAFTPWTTRESFAAFLDDVERLDLVEHVAPVQWTLRLLVTWGSRLLELDDMRGSSGRFDPTSLTYPWRHPDQAVDDLQRAVTALVGVRATAPRARRCSTQVRRLADEAAARAARPAETPRQARAAIPYLTEPWYC